MLIDITLSALAPRVDVTLGVTKLSSGSVEIPPSASTAVALSPVVQGEKGDKGPSGNAAIHYEHLQSIASTEWIVNHNLGLRPQVNVLSLGGVTMWAEVVHSSLNQTVVYFDDPQTGIVVCS